MSKNKKMSLDKLEISSFVTSDQLQNSDTIKGGVHRNQEKDFSYYPECDEPTSEMSIFPNCLTICGQTTC